MDSCEIQSSFMDADYMEIVFPEKNLKKAIGGGITYTDSDILFTLFPKEIDTELVTFSQTSSLRYYPDNKHDNCEY